MCKDWKAYFLGASALALGLVSFSAAAHCDKITGGGWIITEGYPPGSHAAAKGTFGAGGGCKHGQFWGHLEYHDHGNGLNVHWLTITHYGVFPGTTDTAPETDPKREGARLICGTARTNLYGNVDFVMDMRDRGEPGVDDIFRLRLTNGTGIVYSTECDANHTLGGTGRGGGNIQLHKPNPSTDAFPTSSSCPAGSIIQPACTTPVE
jgi:hypothetical protein